MVGTTLHRKDSVSFQIKPFGVLNKTHNVFYKNFKRWILADCVESFKKDSSQSPIIQISKA
jgi:hypothetical protein